MYLIYDCSSIAQPLDYNAPFTDSFQWPRLIHMSWILLGEDFKPIEDFDCIVKPEGFAIDERILKRARIDQEDIDKKGTDIKSILEQFSKSVDKCEYMFSHNNKFNENIVAAEYIRNTMDINMFPKERHCLMEEGTYFCKLPSKRGGYKWPSLSELHAVCFNSSFTPANNARADVIAAARCFIKLMRLNQLEDLFDED